METNAQIHTGLLEQVDRDPPSWALDKILAWDEFGFTQASVFMRRDAWYGDASIAVRRIVGTRHPDYQGKTWRQFLTGGKRMWENLPLHRDNPGYYLTRKHKSPTMSYLTLDGENFYVDADGNHRSVIAKFDFHLRGREQLHGVNLRHCDIDWELQRVFEAMRSWLEDRCYRDPWRVEPITQLVRRDDGPGWKADVYEPLVRLVNRESDEVLKLNAAGAAVVLSDWQRSVVQIEPVSFWKRLKQLIGG